MKVSEGSDTSYRAALSPVRISGSSAVVSVPIRPGASDYLLGAKVPGRIVLSGEDEMGREVKTNILIKKP